MEYIRVQCHIILAVSRTMNYSSTQAVTNMIQHIHREINIVSSTSLGKEVSINYLNTELTIEIFIASQWWTVEGS